MVRESLGTPALPKHCNLVFWSIDQKLFLTDHAITCGVNGLTSFICVWCTAVLFNLFAAAEPSMNVCVAQRTLCNHPSVCIATTPWNCGCEFRPRQFRSVSAELLAATRGTRTLSRKSSTGGLDVRAAGLDIEIWKKFHHLIVFHISIWEGWELCLGGLSPPKTPWRRDCAEPWGWK